MSYRTWEVTLRDLATDREIRDSGGTCMVITAGGTSQVSLFDPDSDFAALTNPISISNGRIRFATAKATEEVDLYVQAPSGHFGVFKGMAPAERLFVCFDKSQRQSVYRVPFDPADYTAAAENDTGFDFIEDMVVLLDSGLYVTAVDATETMDVGILSSESGGDANGFIVAASVATAGSVMAKDAATATRGALLGGGTMDVGWVCDGTAKSLTYTPSAGSDTAAGFIVLPTLLPQF